VGCSLEWTGVPRRTPARTRPTQSGLPVSGQTSFWPVTVRCFGFLCFLRRTTRVAGRHPTDDEAYQQKRFETLSSTLDFAFPSGWHAGGILESSILLLPTSLVRLPFPWTRIVDHYLTIMPSGIRTVGTTTVRIYPQSIWSSPFLSLSSDCNNQLLPKSLSHSAAFVGMDP